MEQNFLNMKDLFVTKGGNLVLMSHKIIQLQINFEKNLSFESRVRLVSLKKSVC